MSRESAVDCMTQGYFMSHWDYKGVVFIGENGKIGTNVTPYYISNFFYRKSFEKGWALGRRNDHLDKLHSAFNL